MLFVALRYSSYIAHQQQELRNKPPPHRPSPLESLAENTPATARPVADSQSPITGGEALGEELLATAGVSMG
jgi:hypothetical protein